MKDEDFFKFIESCKEDAKSLYKETFDNTALIPSGFECYWLGFVHGITMLQIKLNETGCEDKN